jgi:signal transduction histidine kinase/ActR/RegA family two-component response regulator
MFLRSRQIRHEEFVRQNGQSRSLATKFSVFTATLVVWLTAVESFFPYVRAHQNLTEHLALNFLLLAAAVLLARITSRVFVRPLVLLESAMASVREGNLETILVSASGDEIERLTTSFNEMIRSLASSRRQVREHQEQLEEKIRERTSELQLSRDRAEAATRAKSEYLANMSHELRAPLSGIQGMLEIALDSELTTAQKEELETARDCSNSLLALVNDILDLSKIEAGRMTLEEIPFDPRELIGSCSRLLASKAANRGLQLWCEITPEVPAHLLGDTLRVREIIVNLLDNAVKYTNEGSVRLLLTRVPELVANQPRFRIDVIDTGIGIPADKVETIFDAFTQADESTARRYGGTGLGLAITKKLVQMYNGRIWVESEVDRGSTFHVEIDLNEIPNSAGLSEPRASTSPVAVPARPRGQILIVEDNLVNQRVVAGLLNKKGYETTVVNQGREALAALEAASFDLVLMDVQMPVLDGLETTRRIRLDERWRNLPIVGLTAHAMAGDRERCIQAGMNDYLPKPVRGPALIEIVQRHIAGGVLSLKN